MKECKKAYTSVKIEVVLFDGRDIVTVSGDVDDRGWTTPTKNKANPNSWSGGATW